MNYLVTLMQFEDSGNKEVVSTDLIEIIKERDQSGYLEKILIKQKIV
jgi:hypothetical protein